jgi:hypothetical protein
LEEEVKRLALKTNALVFIMVGLWDAMMLTVSGWVGWCEHVNKLTQTRNNPKKYSMPWNICHVTCEALKWMIKYKDAFYHSRCNQCS